MTMTAMAWVVLGAFLVLLVTGLVVGVDALVRRRGMMALAVAGSLVVVGLAGTTAAPMMAADGAASMMGAGMGSMGAGMGSMMGTSSGGGQCRGVPATTAADVRASIGEFAFCPSNLVVHAGEQVTWTNEDNVAHTITSRGGAFDSGTLAQGRSWTVAQLRAGTYDYFCSIHPWMRGRLAVSA